MACRQSCAAREGILRRAHGPDFQARDGAPAPERVADVGEPEPQAIPQGAERRDAERDHVRKAALLPWRLTGGRQGQSQSLPHQPRRHGFATGGSGHGKDHRHRGTQRRIAEWCRLGTGFQADRVPREL